MATVTREQREWIALGEASDWRAYVKGRLRELGKAQEDLARAIDVRLGTLNRWLTGTHGEPGPNHLRAIAEALSGWDRPRRSPTRGYVPFRPHPSPVASPQSLEARSIRAPADAMAA